MIKELSNKIVFDDFVDKTLLTDEEVEILNLYLKKVTIYRIAMDRNMSERNVSRIIRDIKDKYGNYKKIELAKVGIFTAKK